MEARLEKEGIAAVSRRPLLRVVVTMAGVALAYYLAAKLGLSLAMVEKNVTPLWPPTGVALVALLIYGYRMWPAIALAAFAVNAPISPSVGAAAVIAAGNTLAPLAAAFLLRRFDFHPQMDRLRDAAGLVLGAALAAMTISATVGTAALEASGAIPASAFGSTWAVWWAGDAMGVLVFAPLFLVLRTLRISALPAWPRRIEAIILFVAMTVVAKLVFASELRVIYLVFPLVVAIAWRFQHRGAAPAVLIVSVIAVLAAVDGSGPFASGNAFVNMLTLQTFNGGIALTAFLHAAMTTERTATLNALRQAGAALEERVQQRTADLELALKQHEHSEARLEEAQREAHIGSWEWDIASDVVTWTDELFRLHGLEPQSIAVNLASYLERVHPGDRQWVAGVVQKATKDLQPYKFDHRIILPGGINWVHCTGNVIADENGRPVKMNGTAQDISEMKNAEAYAQRLHDAETQRRRGLQLNDEIIQGLVVAKYSLDMGEDSRARGAVEGTLESARRIVTALLGESDLNPGDLVRETAAVVPSRSDEE